MTTVFYPGMGVDIVTPVLCVPKLERIIATGPYLGTFTGKNALLKTFDFICQIANTGALQNKETGEWVEFWDAEIFEEERIEPVFKKYFFKKLGMWMMQFKYNNRTITLNYYVNVDPNDKDFKPPTSEKFDYIIHKSYKWKINPNVYQSIVNTLCKKDKDGNNTTKLIATKSDMRGIWHFSKDLFANEKEVCCDGYSHIVEQTKYTDEPEQALFCIEIGKSDLQK